jgi:hypothetical protein
MSSAVSPALQRLLAITLLVFAIGSAWLVIVSPIATLLSERTEQRGIALRALRRNRALIQAAPGIQSALESVEHSPRWQNFYVAENPQAATLQLEGDLRTWLKSTNNPTAMSAEPATSQGAVTRIAVKVSLTLRVDQLAEALDLLHRQAKHLEIASLTVQAPELQAGDTNPPLMIQAEIAGLMLMRGTGARPRP